jgi:hypothetical protein
VNYPGNKAKFTLTELNDDVEVEALNLPKVTCFRNASVALPLLLSSSGMFTMEHVTSCACDNRSGRDFHS